MSYRYHEKCPYCDTEYTVEYEGEDDLLSFCPACGEQVPELDEDDEYIDDDPDGQFWDE